MKDGHRIPYKSHIKAPTKLLISDPCPFGQLIILTVAGSVLFITVW